MSGGVWIASYVLLWIAVVVLGLAVVVLLRQIGVLHARLRPQGVHFAGEGPARGQPAPPLNLPEVDLPEADVMRAPAALTLVTFTSPTCELCAALLPSLRALERREPDLAVTVVEHSPSTLAAFRAYNVASTPYVVVVDADGIVRGGGVANSLEQVEVLLDSVHPEGVRP